jgi:hypothetical protein
MDDKIVKTILLNYDKYMTTSFTDKDSRDRRMYRELLREAVEKAERVVLDNSDYRPYKLNA